MKNSLLYRLTLYAIRWQLSTPILAVTLIWLSEVNMVIATIVANFIGSMIFFWVDRKIMETPIGLALWEIKEDVVCVDCGKVSTGYRLVQTKNYDRIKDPSPEFRCKECSDKKKVALSKTGVIVE